MKPRTIGCCSFLILLVSILHGCAGEVNSSTTKLNPIDSAPQRTASYKGKVSDEVLFRKFLQAFKGEVKSKNKARIATLFHFPLQTSPQWTNDEMKNTTATFNEGLINSAEFTTYFDDIFSKDAVKLILTSTDDDIAEIGSNTVEGYYTTLQKLTDRKSTLYEMERQYTESNGKETSFGFVFGKVSGHYKIISYFRPWPLK